MENGSCIDNSINKPVKLSEIDVQNIDWVDKTYGFNYLGVSTVIKAIGITNEEKRSLIEILCKAARENNITLEPNVFEIMEQEYVFYGGSKETFDVIAKMKNKNESMTLEMIYNTSPKALKELTNDFSEPLVRLLMMKAKTIGDQKGLLKYIKKAYAIWQKKTKILWSEHPFAGGYPEYFDTMEANIDSDRYITTSGSVPVGSIEYYQLMSQQKENQSSGLYSKDMLDAAVAAVKAQIPHFVYDQQNEGLSIVYGDDKKELNLSGIIEEKAKAVFNKQLESLECSDEDIDQILGEVYGQDLVEQVNQEMVEKDEQCDKYEEKDYEDEDDNVETPRIFKKMIKEDKVIEALGNLYSDKVKGKRRWYVIYRVLLFIEWLRLTNQIDFINWVKSHFGWNGVKEFRGVQSEFTHYDPNKWDLIIVKGKMGKSDNEELGPDYYDFAVAVRDALVDVNEVTGEMQDKDEFRVNPHQGVLHNSKWK